LRSREQLKDEAKQQAPTNFEAVYAEKERDVLRDLIDQQLLLEKGKDMGSQPTRRSSRSSTRCASR